MELPVSKSLRVRSPLRVVGVANEIAIIAYSLRTTVLTVLLCSYRQLELATFTSYPIVINHIYQAITIAPAIKLTLNSVPSSTPTKALLEALGVVAF